MRRRRTTRPANRLSHWSEGVWEPIELEAAGDRVWMPARLRLRGRSSGIDVDLDP